MNIKSVIILSVVFLISMFFVVSNVNAYSIYNTGNNDNRLYRYDSDLDFNINSYEVLDTPNMMCGNDDGSKILVTQGRIHLTPKTSKYFEGGSGYTYLPSGDNSFCQIKNDVIASTTLRSISSVPYGNISFFNTLTNAYYSYTYSNNYQNAVCVNSAGTIIIGVDGTGVPVFEIYKNYVLNSTISRVAISGGSDTICQIRNDNDFFGIDRVASAQLILYNLTGTNTSLYTFPASQKVRAMKLVNNIMYVATDRFLYYDSVADNLFTPLNVSLGCNSTEFNSRGCFDVSDDNSVIAIIVNNTVYASESGSPFVSLGFNSTSVLITGSASPNTTTVSRCIPETNYLCTNPLYVGSSFYCDILNRSYCSGGCIESNTTGSDYCNNPTNCNNDCYTLGLNSCDSTTSFVTCGLYGTDLCLHYSTPNSCLSGQICNIGQCEALNYTNGKTSNPSFTVNPYSTTSESTVYTLDNNKKRLDVSTTAYAHIQKFSISFLSNTTYTSQTCDYEETLIDYDNQPSTAYASNQYIKTFNTVMIDTGILYVGTYFYDNNNLNYSAQLVTLQDISDTNVNSLAIVRNTTAKSLCFYNLPTETGADDIQGVNLTYNTTTLLFCDYSYNSYDDLKNITLKYIIDFDSDTMTLTAYIDRVTDTILNSKIMTFSNPVDTINSVVFNNLNQTDSSYISNGSYYFFNYSYITQPKGFETTLYSDYSFLSCTSSILGCYKVRTYNNLNGYPDFTNYLDWQICINQLNGNSIDLETKQSLSNLTLSTGAKWLIYFAIVLILLGTFIVGGISAGNPTIGFIMGAVTALAWTIICSIKQIPLIGGIIPVWFAVFIVILTILLSVLISMKSVNSDGV